MYEVFNISRLHKFRSAGKNIEAKLSEKEQEIELLRQRDSINTDAISSLSDSVMKMMNEIELLKQKV